MPPHRLRRPVEDAARVVAQQKAEPRVEAAPPLGVELPEAVEPLGGPRAGAHADLEHEDLGRELVAHLEVAQQGPEVRDGVRDRLGVVGVGSPARQHVLEGPTRHRLPRGDVLPEEGVEAPDHARAEGAERLERHAAGVALEGGRERRGEPPPRGLPDVDRQLHERHRPAAAVDRPADRDRLAEALAVLDPVEVHPQTREHPPIGRRRLERGHDLPHQGGRPRPLARQEVHVQDHRCGATLIRGPDERKPPGPGAPRGGRPRPAQPARARAAARAAAGRGA